MCIRLMTERFVQLGDWNNGMFELLFKGLVVLIMNLLIFIMLRIFIAPLIIDFNYYDLL